MDKYNDISGQEMEIPIQFSACYMNLVVITSNMTTVTPSNCFRWIKEWHIFRYCYLCWHNYFIIAPPFSLVWKVTASNYSYLYIYKESEDFSSGTFFFLCLKHLKNYKIYFNYYFILKKLFLKRQQWVFP